MAANQKALLFGLEDQEFYSVKKLVSAYGIEAVNVPLAKYTLTLESIISEKPIIGIMPYAGPALQETMLILHGLTGTKLNNVLDAFSACPFRPSLAAVTTESNLKWSALQLYTNLTEEREAIRNNSRRG